MPNPLRTAVVMDVLNIVIEKFPYFQPLSKNLLHEIFSSVYVDGASLENELSKHSTFYSKILKSETFYSKTITILRKRQNLLNEIKLFEKAKVHTSGKKSTA